jgi:phosphatidylethanolamine/phosphatidyl-N-methylethanolamine N-methyltransferase
MKYTGYSLFGSGLTLVVSSAWALGLTGTYLGDYFGILMKEKVVGFPFNILNNPMYVGSTLCFLGNALRKGSVAGLFITAIVHVCYTIALLFETPFTDHIYSEAAKGTKKKSK